MKHTSGSGCKHCNFTGTVRFDDYGHIPCQDCGVPVADSNVQPDPIKTNEPNIKDLVIADLQYRAEQGKEKYGVYLQPSNGRDPMIDLYQELVDAAMYARQELYKRYGK